MLIKIYTNTNHKNTKMSVNAGESLFIEEELKIVVIGEPSTGKVNYENPCVVFKKKKKHF